MIPSVRFEQIHLGLLMPLGLLYTLHGVILLLNFSPFPPKKDLEVHCWDLRVDEGFVFRLTYLGVKA